MLLVLIHLLNLQPTTQIQSVVPSLNLLVGDSVAVESNLTSL
jgi:hypothetical protein